MVDDSAEDRELCRVLLEEVYGPEPRVLRGVGSLRGLENLPHGRAGLRVARLQSPGYDRAGVSDPVAPGSPPPRTGLRGGDAHRREQLPGGPGSHAIRRTGLPGQRPHQRPEIGPGDSESHPESRPDSRASRGTCPLGPVRGRKGCIAQGTPSSRQEQPASHRQLAAFAGRRPPPTRPLPRCSRRASIASKPSP